MHDWVSRSIVLTSLTNKLHLSRWKAPSRPSQICLISSKTAANDYHLHVPILKHPVCAVKRLENKPPTWQVHDAVTLSRVPMDILRVKGNYLLADSRRPYMIGLLRASAVLASRKSMLPWHLQTEFLTRYSLLDIELKHSPQLLTHSY